MWGVPPGRTTFMHSCHCVFSGIFSRTIFFYYQLLFSFLFFSFFFSHFNDVKVYFCFVLFFFMDIMILFLFFFTSYTSNVHIHKAELPFKNKPVCGKAVTDAKYRSGPHSRTGLAAPVYSQWLNAKKNTHKLLIISLVLSRLMRFQLDYLGKKQPRITFRYWLRNCFN